MDELCTLKGILQGFSIIEDATGCKQQHDSQSQVNSNSIETPSGFQQRSFLETSHMCRLLRTSMTLSGLVRGGNVNSDGEDASPLLSQGGRHPY